MHPASLILAIAIHATLALKVHAADDTFACLDQLSGPIETIRGDRGYSNFWRNVGDASWPKDQRFDARGASWDHQTVPTHKPDNPWLIILGGGWRAPIKERMCWAGGRIMGTNPDNATYRDVKNEAGDGLQFNSKSGIVDGIRIHKAAETGLSIIHGDNFTVKNVWISHQKANCIENDHLGAGIIDDVLLDGCFDVFSIDPGAKYKGKSRSDRVVTINHSLFREHKVDAPRENSLGCGVIIKTKSTSPSLRIYNSVFALECWSPEKFKLGAGGPPDRLRRAFKRTLDCKNNVIAWLSDASLPSNFPTPPFCFRIVKGQEARNLWSAAKQNWIDCHPNVAHIPGVDPAADPTKCNPNAYGGGG